MKKKIIRADVFITKERRPRSHTRRPLMTSLASEPSAPQFNFFHFILLVIFGRDFPTGWPIGNVSFPSTLCNFLFAFRFGIVSCPWWRPIASTAATVTIANFLCSDFVPHQNVGSLQRRPIVVPLASDTFFPDSKDTNWRQEKVNVNQMGQWRRQSSIFVTKSRNLRHVSHMLLRPVVQFFPFDGKLWVDNFQKKVWRKSL